MKVRCASLVIHYDFILSRNLVYLEMSCRGKKKNIELIEKIRNIQFHNIFQKIVLISRSKAFLYINFIILMNIIDNTYLCHRMYVNFAFSVCQGTDTGKDG